MKERNLFSLPIILMVVLLGCRSVPTDSDGETRVAETPTARPAATATASPAGPESEDTYPAPDPSSQGNAYPAPVDQAVAPPVSAITFDGAIAFHSSRSGLLQIYTMRGDSSTGELLSSEDVEAYEPAWSPDCSAIAYTQASPNRNLDIYLMDADGSNARPLLAEDRPDTNEWAPAWSPDGKVIAYQTNPGQRFNVCFAGSDGSDLGCLDREDGDNAHPAWSPGGQTLFFASNRDGDWEIFRTEWGSDSPPLQLTNNSGPDFHPRVSPDGSRVVFQANRTVNHDIFVMNADGSGEVQLTFADGDDVDPAWLGNDRVLYGFEQVVGWDLYVMDVDGSNATRLTAQPGSDRGPTWCQAG